MKYVNAIILMLYKLHIFVVMAHFAVGNNKGYKHQRLRWSFFLLLLDARIGKTNTARDTAGTFLTGTTFSTPMGWGLYATNVMGALVYLLVFVLRNWVIEAWNFILELLLRGTAQGRAFFQNEFFDQS